MRGWLTLLLGSEIPKEQIGRALVICTAEPAFCARIIDQVRSHFPQAQLAFVAPKSYRSLLGDKGILYSIEAMKRRKWGSLRLIRQQEFDATILMLCGTPVFRRAKLWALLTNFRVLIVYNENLDSFACTREKRSLLLVHILRRLREAGWPTSLRQVMQRVVLYVLFPIILLYLLTFAGWVYLRRDLNMRKRNRAASPNPKVKGKLPDRLREGAESPP